jgi:hypothetical protein
MAKKACSKKTISFKTKRGRDVRFTGRPGGSDGCGKIRRKVSSWARSVGKVGKRCAKQGRPGTARNAACLRAGIRELKSARA